MKLRVFMALSISLLAVARQPLLGQGLNWGRDGNNYYREEGGEFVRYDLPENKKTVLIRKARLVPRGMEKPLSLRSVRLSADNSRALIYTNTKRVWRADTRGDYWVFQFRDSSLKQLGKGRPPSSMMFAKFSPDGSKVAYVSDYNLYVEDLASGSIKPLTKGGNRKLINGTFDWAYEEEFFCRDGFRWSPDGTRIAFWQIDAQGTKDYMMLNNTDSIYPRTVPVEYPVAGEPPSRYKIGVVDVRTAAIKWMQVPDEATWRTYVPRMEWAPDNAELIIQHLNRKQNESRLMLCNVKTGQSRVIFEEKDPAWIDILPSWDPDYAGGGWDWLNKGQAFLWASEKDGWRHLYRISRDGKNETLITNGTYDVMDISTIDEAGGYVYFHASPDNATQKYLCRTSLDGSGSLEILTPPHQKGTHTYRLSPNAKYAQHSFSNYYTPPVNEWVSVPGLRPLNGVDKVNEAMAKADPAAGNISFFKVKTVDNVEMDAWMMKPAGFDSTKKYPVLFYVYTEPWGQNVRDMYGVSQNFMYKGDMSRDGYIYISIDNRGTPVPKGREWRKSIYRKIGLLNIHDQAMAAREIMKWPFVDTGRIAVWGWSGGGTATLNLMFQYPEIYKTGIAIAPVANQLTYDNIYQERYMGLPQENREDFIKGSPMTYAKNLAGNLLYIHGTGDDNVHFNNAEMLFNELIRHGKQFQMMNYPNRTHGISEGEGTWDHLQTLFTKYLKEHCPPGPVSSGEPRKASKGF